MKISPQLNFSWPISFSSYLRMRIPRPCSTRILLVFFSFSITFTASQHAVAQKQVTVVGEDAIQFEDKQDAILIPIRLKISKIILRSLRAGGDSTGELRLQAKWSTTGFANKFNKMSNSEKKFKTINSAKAEFFVHLPDDEGRIKTIKKNTVLVRGQVQDFIFPIPAKIVKSTLRIMLGNQSWKPTISASIEWKKNKIPFVHNISYKWPYIY